MEVDLLAGFGVGFLGSRLKRLAERMQADAAEVARSLDLPPLDADMEGVFDLPVPPEPAPLPENAAPSWILPLMRILRTEAGGDLGRACVSACNFDPLRRGIGVQF